MTLTNIHNLLLCINGLLLLCALIIGRKSLLYSLNFVGDFMKEDKPVYEDITDFKKLKSFMEANLEDYNNEPGYIAMDLVLFRDAIEHGIS